MKKIQRMFAITLATTMVMSSGLSVSARTLNYGYQLNTLTHYGLGPIAGPAAPVPLTYEQLHDLISEAPAPEDTLSAMKLPNRALTSTELDDWKDEYHELGGINTIELEIFRLINAERARAGLPRLAISDELMGAARFKSQTMDDLGFFGHHNPWYTVAFYELFGHINHNENLVGSAENLFRGTVTPERVVSGWMNSPSHRSNILDPRAKTLGIGHVPRHATAKFGY